MTKTNFFHRIVSVLLCMALIVSLVPFIARAEESAIQKVSDPSTMDGWKDYFSVTGDLSTQNAGRVWIDKSVFTDDSVFRALGITKDATDSFLVALSAIAANTTVTGMSHVPTDSMLILDVSGSMNDGDNDVAEELVDAANASIRALLETNSYNRVGVVLYSGSSSSSSNYTTGAIVLLPLNRYTTDAQGNYLTYTRTSGWDSTETIGIDSDVRIEGTQTRPASVSKEVVGATYIQRGLALAMEQFTASGNDVMVNDPTYGTFRRKPVMVLMSDGAPSLGSTNFTDPGNNQQRGYNLGSGSGTSAALGFVTQLTAAYAKAQIEEKYGTSALFYTLGLGLSNSDTVALAVMDPKNQNASTAVDDFWNDVRQGSLFQSAFRGYNHVSVGQTVSLGSGQSVTKIDTPLNQYYVDKYFAATGSSGNLAADLEDAFEDIVGSIQLQSGYYPTLISENEHLSGYVSFVDKIGLYMNVTDIKGVLIHDTLFSGKDLASNFVASGGALGTPANPTELGFEMLHAVRTRLGLPSDEVAATLIQLAYENGQLSYTDENNFSNYIGWYANKDGEFLGFYHEGVTVLPEATGNDRTDPAFTVRSYGYLGELDESHGVTESDMMYATVQVRTEIQTGQELVTFAVPAALIPTVTYNVTLSENGDLEELTVSGATAPIRLVYEVALDDRINAFTAKDILSDEYLADSHNKNADGSVNFYSNRFDHDNLTGYGTVNTYAYFNPSRQNDRYYFTEDTPVLSDQSGTVYSGAARPSANDTYYHAYKVYEKNGSSLSAKTLYRALSAEAKATAVRGNDGSWYVPRGNVRVYLSGLNNVKSENKTGTLPDSFVPFVDTRNHSVNDTGYEFYVGGTLGNNGKLTLMPETGIKLTKTLADGTAPTDEAFTFTLENLTKTDDTRDCAALLVLADGTSVEKTVSFVNGEARVELKANETLYIGSMDANDVIRIEEVTTAAYLPTVTGLSSDDTVTVSALTMAEVVFENAERGTGNLTVTKEVDHDFGTEYQIPANLVFTVDVTLSGIGTRNATFAAAHTNGTVSSVTTDANGRFTVTLRHNEAIELFDLPAGTEVTVTERTPSTGFTPIYYDNGTLGNGTVSVENDTTASVIVINDYAPAVVYPVNISVAGTKQLVGRNWMQSDSFHFRLEKLLTDGSWQLLAEADATMGDADFDFNDAFASERYAQSGTYYYRVIEVEPDAPLGGIVYDKTVHSFAVFVGDTDMDGQLEITSVRSNRPNSTVVSQNASGWSVDFTFVNTYSNTASATVTIDVNKVIENIGGSPKSLAGYTFGLFDAVTGERYGELLTTTERGFARFVYTYSHDGGAFTEKTFSYIIREIKPDPVPAGWNYSDAQIPVTITFTDNGDGTISGTVYTGDAVPPALTDSASATFTNRYDPRDAALPIDFVKKELSGRDLVNGEFSFEVQNPDGSAVLSGKNDASGNVVFDRALSFDEVGIYSYLIKETSADAKGVKVDKTVYYLLVTVTDVNGVLVADYSIVDLVGDEIVFKNQYTASSVSHIIEGNKTLRGKTLLNDEFTFILKSVSVNGQAVAASPVSTHNLAGGHFAFPAITYTQAGTYVYTVEEQIPAGGKQNGIVYDTTVYTVTVVIADNGEGALGVESERVTLANGSPANAILFVNEYEPNAAFAQFSGNKQLTGKVNFIFQGGEYDFSLYASDETFAEGAHIETVENVAGGSFTFTAIEFDEVGNKFFIVKEVGGGQTVDGVTFDDTVYYVYVSVTDDLLGQLHATVHVYDEEGIPQDGILFINAYAVSGSSSVILSGEKTLSGREWGANDAFTFELFEADESYNVTAQSPLYTANADGTTHRFGFELSFDAEDVGNTYYYVLKEKNAGQTILGLTYSDGSYKIKVTVSDNGDGTVKAVATAVDAEIDALDFTNRYTAPADIAVDVNIDKTVVNAGKAQITPEGFGFTLDDQLDGATDYTVYADADGKASIALTFTADDIGKTYTYKLFEVNDGRANVTYSDKVYDVTIAITLDEDTYTLVATKTVDTVEVSDIAAAFENTYDYTPPKTGDTNLALWLGLMLLCAGAAFGAYVYGKRRRTFDA